MKLQARKRATELEAPNLETLWVEYLQDCIDRGLSKKTVMMYELQGAPLVEWWLQYGHTHQWKLSQAAFREFDAWMGAEYINKQGNKPSYYIKHKASVVINQFVVWLRSEGCIDFDIQHWIVKHEAQPVHAYWPTLDDLQRMFDAVPQDRDRLRNTALFAFFLSTGCRRQEAANLMIENVHFQTPLSDISLGSDHSGHALLEITKTKKPRTVWFCSKAGLLVKAWLRSTGHSSGLVFRLGDAGIRFAMLKATDVAGVSEVTPHGLRRAWCDWFMVKHAQDAMAMTVAKLQLGHSNGRDVTSNHYINLRNKSRVIEWLQRYHTSPLEEIEFDWSKFPVQEQPQS